jgi:hypothetical protein
MPLILDQFSGRSGGVVIEKIDVSLKIKLYDPALNPKFRHPFLIYRF